jgi:hypothetical protein
MHNEGMGTVSSQVSSRCFCAFCRSERTVYRKRHISANDVFLSMVVSLLLSFIFWQDFDPRLVVFFALSLVVSELFVVFRWRMSIACSKCGFDPVLYKKNPELAALRVKAHYGERLEDPLSVFAPPPKLPVLIRKKA